MAIKLCDIPTCYSYQKYCRLHSSTQVKEKEPIAKVAESSKKSQGEYNRKCAKFKKEHPLCQAKLKDICKKVTADIHHMKGKASKEDLLNEKYWLAVCRACHDHLHANPAFAREQGLSVSRHKKQTA